MWDGVLSVLSCQAGRVSLKVRLAMHFSLRRESIPGRVEAELALKKALPILPKLSHVSLNALDMSHQRQSSGPISMALLRPCELDRSLGNAGMGRLYFIGFFLPWFSPSVFLTAQTRKNDWFGMQSFKHQMTTGILQMTKREQVGVL